MKTLKAIWKILPTTLWLLPNVVQAQDLLADGFVWPVLSGFTSEAIKNSVSPLTRGEFSACQPPEWHVVNGFGNRYLAEGCQEPHAYHPALDFNLCPLGSRNETDVHVYSIGEGKVIAKGTVSSNSNRGSYLTIQHLLPRPLERSEYSYLGTEVNGQFDVVFASYLHIQPSLLAVGDSVTKGQHIADISSCCSHLHFELQVTGRGITHCGPCGYCSSPQDLTDAGYIDPIRFLTLQGAGIRVAATDAGNITTVAMTSNDHFEIQEGTIQAFQADPQFQSSHLVTAEVTEWSPARIGLFLGEESAYSSAVPLHLQISRADGTKFPLLHYPFADVKDAVWYTTPVLELKNSGVVTGKTEGFYWPEAPITRAEFTALLWRAFGGGASICNSSLPFHDVSAEDWFCGVVSGALSAGWINSAAEFRPNALISRLEAAYLLSRLVSESAPNFLVAFSDITQIPEAWTAISTVSALGIMNGVPRGTDCQGQSVEPEARFFCPDQVLDRAQAATLVHRLHQTHRSPLENLQLNPLSSKDHGRESKP